MKHMSSKYSEMNRFNGSKGQVSGELNFEPSKKIKIMNENKKYKTNLDVLVPKTWLKVSPCRSDGRTGRSA